MRSALILLFWLGLSVGPVHAGAWPRSEGGHFFATTMQLAAASKGGPYASYSTFYYEYGWNGKLTVGVDIGRAVSGDIKAIAYARLPVFTRLGHSRLAFEIGVGSISGSTVIRPGLSFGRSIKTRFGDGWISAESMAEVNAKSGETNLKADLTVGLKVRPKLKVLMQLQTGAPAMSPYFVRFAPSVVYAITEGTQIEFGLTAGITGDDQIGIKFGIWREF